MISKENPNSQPLNIDYVDCSGLMPKTYTLTNGNAVHFFPEDGLGLLKVDFTFEAGSAYQPKLLVAAATNQLFSHGTKHHTADEIAEFLDARGIVMDYDTNYLGATLSVYSLPKYARELFPLLKELFLEPAFPKEEFDIYMAKRRQELQSGMQQTSYVARNLFYNAVYGNHPLGFYAVPSDVSKVVVDDVRTFYARHYNLNDAEVLLSGQVDEQILQMFDKVFCGSKDSKVQDSRSDRTFLTEEAMRPTVLSAQHRSMPLKGAVQSTVRIGRLLPWRWDDIRYNQFQILNTILGGYFGSRLMSNLREEKGLTYGIYSQTNIFRGSILFFITAEVRGDATQEAVKEIYNELHKLMSEPVSQEELSIVKNYMVGDFMRSIDGTFERSTRYRLQNLSGATELFTEHYKQSLNNTTPRDLQNIAKEIFQDNMLTEVVVGVV
jgi:predicted Zn-dependent peptidase